VTEKTMGMKEVGTCRLWQRKQWEWKR